MSYDKEWEVEATIEIKTSFFCHKGRSGERST